MKDLGLHVHVAHQHSTLGQPSVIQTLTYAILVRRSDQLNYNIPSKDDKR